MGGFWDDINPMNYDSYWDRGAGWVGDQFSSGADKLESLNNWGGWDTYNDIQGRAWEKTGPIKGFYDFAIDPWVDIANKIGNPMTLPMRGINKASGDLMNTFDYIIHGDDGQGSGMDFDFSSLPPEIGGIVSPDIDVATGESIYIDEMPDEEIDSDTGGDGGVGALMQQLAEMQRAEARRTAGDAETFINTEYDRLINDYDRWEQDRIATSGTAGTVNRGRLDESLDYIGVDSARAVETLAGIGIDAEATARQVGGEVGASLYGIYNMGAQLMDNLDRISADTLDEMRSASAGDVASGLYQVKENLAQTLAGIDQGLVQYQIGVSQANAAAAKALEDAQAQSQMVMNYAEIFAEASAGRGGQITNPFELFALMQMGEFDPDVLFPSDSASNNEFSYGGWTAEDMKHPIFPDMSMMDIEEKDEFLDLMGQAGYTGTGSFPMQGGGFDPSAINIPPYLRQ